MHRILCERAVAEHPQREPVDDSAEAVVQLRERALVGARGKCDDGLVGEVREIPTHRRRAYS